MAVETEINLLTEIASAASLLNTVQADKVRLFRILKGIGAEFDLVCEISNTLETSIHDLTKMLVDRGTTQISLDDDVARILGSIDRAQFRRTEVIDDLNAWFGELGSVIGYDWTKEDRWNCLRIVSPRMRS